ncbi:lyase family protein [Ramlibacter sp.]|uniref:lyase family protein n=1 Tax=Ramlibacter sp. TaxID=1917967 RepID=UPI003D0A2F4D
MPLLRRALPIALLVSTLQAAQAQTAPWTTVEEHCKTAEACRTEADRLLAQRPRGATSALAQSHDYFYWFGRINMASTIANVEKGIIPPQLAGPIARGVAQSINQGVRPGGRRPSDVLETEKIITDVAGPEATLIHTGRSRQDMHSTISMAQTRTELLDFTDALNAWRAQLLNVAQQHAETVVPSYTNGVQAMPISLGHYLLAYADSFARDGERIRQAWPRIDRSALGTAVLANSSWPLDRQRLADLLGFGALAVNGYDATQISQYDVGLETAQLAGSVALRVGTMMQDIHVQYHQTRPWMLLAPGSTYTSSAMPQKANPGVIQNTRGLASDVVSSVQAVLMRAHNVTPGMIDYKYTWLSGGARTFVLGTQLMRDATNVMTVLRIDPKRALEELESDWTTSMELAETLQREHGIPFRVGHHFASEIVQHGRRHNLLPKTFPYGEAQRIYAEARAKYNVGAATLPMDEAAFRRTLSPEAMVKTRVGIGGPQPAEVRRMLAEAQAALARDRQWVQERRMKQAEADARLNAAFAQLLAR